MKNLRIILLILTAAVMFFETPAIAVSADIDITSAYIGEMSFVIEGTVNDPNKNAAVILSKSDIDIASLDNIINTDISNDIPYFDTVTAKYDGSFFKEIPLENCSEDYTKYKVSVFYNGQTNVIPLSSAYNSSLISNLIITDKNIKVIGRTKDTYEKVAAVITGSGENIEAVTGKTANIIAERSKVSDSTGDFEIDIPNNGFEIDGKKIFLICGNEISVADLYSPINIHVKIGADKTKADGSEKNPFPDLYSAADYTAKLKELRPKNVIIHEGEYVMDKPLILKQAMGGDKLREVTYMAADCERVVLSGAKKLDISKFQKVSGEARNKLSAESRNHVLQYNLSDESIPDGIINFTDKYSEYQGENAKPPLLYYNGKNQPISRWPDDGYITLKEDETTVGSAKGDNDETNMAEITVNNKDTSRWSGATDAMAEGFFGQEWHGEWTKIADISGNKVRLATYTNYGVKPGSRIAFTNMLEEIDTPGEWFIDKNSKILYWYPTKTLEENDVFEIAVLENNLIYLYETQYINFIGIELSKNADKSTDLLYGSSNGMLIHKSNNCVISDCTFKDIGQNGIYINDSIGCIVENSFIGNTGNAGVILNSRRRDVLEGRNIVRDCYITNVSRDSDNSKSANINITAYNYGAVVKNNILSHTPYDAVLLAGGNDSLIENNEIYYACQDTADAGAIYKAKDMASYDNIIRNNYIHDIGMGYETKEQASGIFLDDAAVGTLIENNVIDLNNTKRTSGVKLSGGRDNIINNNHILNATYGIYMFGLKSLTSDKINTLSRVPYTSQVWLEKYPQVAVHYQEAMNDEYKSENTITNNTVWNCGKITDGWALNLIEPFSIIENNTESDTAYDVSSVGTNAVRLPEEQFSLLYPRDCQDNILGDDITLRWEKMITADEYEYEVSEDADFSNIIYSGRSSKTSAVIENVSADKTYYWRVRGINNSVKYQNITECEKIFSFSTASNTAEGDFCFENGRIIYNYQNRSKAEQPHILIVKAENTDGAILGCNIIRSQGEITSKVTKSNSLDLPGFSKLKIYDWYSLSDMRPMSSLFTVNQ